MTTNIVENKLQRTYNDHIVLFIRFYYHIYSDRLSCHFYDDNKNLFFSIQMGKQTMGTPCQALKYRSDNKLYRIQVTVVFCYFPQ